MIQTSSEFLFFVLPPLVLLKSQTVMQIMCQNIIGCGLQGLNVQGKAATLHSLGRIYANKGEVDKAIALYNQVLEIDECTGNVQGKAATLKQLGILYANKGDVDQAIALFNQSLEIEERIGNVKGKAMTLWCLGHLAEHQGEYTKAISYLQPALEILQRLKSPDTESVSASLDRIIRNS